MFARTKRLILRPGWKEDASALAAAITHHDVMKHLPRLPYPYRAEDAAAYMDHMQETESPLFLAFARTGGAPRLVGGCGLHKRDDGGHELGYWIARPFWGLGFATEAARAVMSLARSTGLRSVVALHGVDNHASARVLHKVGFRPTGRIEQHFSPARGVTADYVVMEDQTETLMPDDPAAELYTDRLPVAA